MGKKYIIQEVSDNDSNDTLIGCGCLTIILLIAIICVIA